MKRWKIAYLTIGILTVLIVVTTALIGAYTPSLWVMTVCARMLPVEVAVGSIATGLCFAQYERSMVDVIMRAPSGNTDDAL